MSSSWPVGGDSLEGWFEDPPAAEPARRRRDRRDRRERPSGRTPVWAVLLALSLLLVVFGAAAVGVDWYARNMEMRALITAIEASEQAMGDAQDAVGSAYADLQQGTPGAAGALSNAASEGAARIRSAGAAVGEVRVLPWHTEIQRAKNSYVVHNRSWQDFLERVAKDGEELARPQPEVDESFANAEPLLRGAVPPFPLFGLVGRIDVIYAPEPGPGEVSA